MSIPPQHPHRSSYVSDQLPPAVTSGSMSSTTPQHSAASHTTTSQTSPNHTLSNPPAAQVQSSLQAGPPHQNGSATPSSSIPAVPHVTWSPPALLTSMVSPQDFESATPRLLIAPPMTPGVSPPSLTTPTVTTPPTRPPWNDGKDSPVAGGSHLSPAFTSPLAWLNLPPQDLHHFLQTVQGPAGPHLPMQEIWDVQRAGGQIQAQANGVNPYAGQNGLHNGTTHAPQAPQGLEQDFWSDEEDLEIHLSTTGAGSTVQSTQASQSGPSQGAASLAGGLPQVAQSIEELVEQIAHDIGEDSPGSPGAAGTQAQGSTGSAASSSSTSAGPLVRTTQWSLPPHPGSQDRGNL